MPPFPEPKQKSSMLASPDFSDHPPRAYEFVHEGLDYTVTMIHGARINNGKENRHVSGAQLCEGLRELALARWGRLARTVLHRWNIQSTLDFGRIVFSLIDAGQLQKLDEDSIEDFRDIFDFETALEADYRIPSHS